VDLYRVHDTTVLVKQSSKSASASIRNAPRYQLCSCRSVIHTGVSLARVAWTYILQSEWLFYLVEFGFISHPAFHHSTELSTGEAPPGVSHKGNGLRVAWHPEPQDADAQMALEQPGLPGLGELLQRPRQAGATQLAVRQHGPQRSSVFPRAKPITGIVRVRVSGASFRANRYLRS
jgi:hypothetical protein